MTVIKNPFMILLTCALFITFYSCKKSAHEIETQNLSSAISKVNITNQVKWIVILPGLGCHGCIQEGEAFVKKYIGNKNVFFVLTNISSLKILQQKVGVQLKNRSNVYVDYDDIFNMHTDNNVYPCIVQLENGKVIEHEFQSPKNGAAFYNLRSKIIKEKQ